MERRMRPALQKFLIRPSSLDILRILVGIPENAPVRQTRRCLGSDELRRSQYSSQAVEKRLEDDVGREGDVKNATRKLSSSPELRSVIGNAGSSETSDVQPVPYGLLENSLWQQTNFYGPWGLQTWSSEKLDFESDIHNINPRRLLSRTQHKKDVNLWGFLLAYRQRTYGPASTALFWEAMVRERVQIPTEGQLAQRLWKDFITAGIQGHIVLEEVCDYAEFLHTASGKYWSGFYGYIVRYFLATGQGSEAIRWHDRLYKQHRPSNRRFLKICKDITYQKGDMAALRTIYSQSSHRNAYASIIPVLCAHEDYNSALDWHYYLVEAGDFPWSLKQVNPLIRYLTIYNQPEASRLTRSLVKVGVPDAANLSKEIKDTAKISREMMNLIHGKTLNVPEKFYNDSLGARWFATNWVTLDVAISGIHALGVREIGPLSLQSIALRGEIDSASIVHRLDKLEQSGISIGTSKFARALNKFARRKKEEHLAGLLRSDQHPEELENRELQETLLVDYARGKQWSDYRRTLEIQLIGNSKPRVERRNIQLRSSFASGNQQMSGIKRYLRQMKADGIPVTSQSVYFMVRTILRPRRRGRRPIAHIHGFKNDIETAITLLRAIRNSGHFVSIVSWKEIMKRLGMTGRLLRLEQLCIYLAVCYGSDENLKTMTQKNRPTSLQIPAAHPLHPLKLLFPVSLQKAIVEWGFIHNLKDEVSNNFAFRPLIRRHRQPGLRSITSGIALLKKLAEYGVDIDGKAVRSAIIARLVTYFGPGRSTRLYNRIAKARIGMTLNQVATRVDEALGGEYLGSVDISSIVQTSAYVRLRRRYRAHMRRDGRRNVHRDRLPVWSPIAASL